MKAPVSKRSGPTVFGCLKTQGSRQRCSLSHGRSIARPLVCYTEVASIYEKVDRNHLPAVKVRTVVLGRPDDASLRMLTKQGPPLKLTRYIDDSRGV